MDLSAQRELARFSPRCAATVASKAASTRALVPPDKATAYRVAALVAEELGWRSRGWKIAAMKEEMQKALRTDQPIYGRVFAPFVKPSPVTVVHAKLASPIPEVEYQARLGADLPPREKPYTVEEVADAVASLHPGLELAECRFIHDQASRRCRPSWPTARARAPSSTAPRSTTGGPATSPARKRRCRANGKLRRKGTAAAALDHPMVPLTWLANELSRTGVGMKAGQMISTGTLTGMLAPKPGETYVADFGPFGSVTLSFT